MRNRPSTSVVASPVLVGAVTVLIVIVGVMLAYNANKGLPFVPTLDVAVRAPNAAALGRGAEVREGGFRVGFVESVEPVRDRKAGGVAQFNVKLDRVVGDLPVDSRFTIRPRSPLGLKYLELERGASAEAAPAGHVFPAGRTRVPVQFDEFNSIYDEETRSGVQRNLKGFGDTLAGRGVSLNEAIGELPRVFRLLAPVSRNLSDPETDIGRFFRELGDAARVIEPVAHVQATTFARAANTFEALARDPEALKETISRSHPAFQAGIESFPVQRPFLNESAALAREMQPVARDLRPALPVLNRALAKGVPVVRRSPAFYEGLRPPLRALRELAEDPATGIALRALTATATTLKPQLRYLGPFQTVCNYWTYFWTNLAEHLSQEGTYGLVQRAQIKSTGRQRNNPADMGSPFPANGEDYQGPNSRGSIYHMHATSYNAAITDDGKADCENGQRGYMRRLARFSEPELEIVTDPHFPGAQGPTYAGVDQVPEGQTFTREPETGVNHE